ncbi:hypothetical protein PIROE2DRAFT_19048, partial [Piromyces sp. E2]
MLKSFVRPFDLENGPLIRVGFIKNEVLLIDMHHVICDGTSFLIIKEEINKYYNEGTIESVDIQFSDYALNLEEKKKNGYFENQIEFYKKMFADEEYETLNIPNKNDMNNEDNENENGNENENKSENCNYLKEIDEITSNNIDKYIQEKGILKAAFFLSIYGFVLSKYSGQNIIYTSITNVNRINYHTQRMIGMFVSTLPILLKFDKEDETMLDIIKENMNLLIDVYNNQDISFSELSKSLKLENVNNGFVYQPNKSMKELMSNTSIFDEDIYNSEIEDINNSLMEENGISKFDISFNLVENDENYSVSVEYNSGLYDKLLIERLVDSYIEVLRNIDYFETSIKEIEYIPEEERNKILNEFNSNKYEYNHDKVYHEEFSRVAKSNPQNVAIVFNGKEITYEKLDQMSNSLGHYLRNNGIGRGDVVPIVSERSYLFIVAFLAVMKSGAAYLPIDPEFPKERIQCMIEETNAKLMLKCISNPEIRERIKFEKVKEYSLMEHNYENDIHEINNINRSDDICYLLFTSGTTGKPKGTLIRHDNLINYCIYGQTVNHKDVYDDQFNTVLAFSKFTFDMSVGEIHYPLLRGKKIILCDDDEFNNPESIGELISKYNIHYLISVPSRFENYLNNEKFSQSFKNIRFLLIGGEKCNTKILNTIRKYSD